MCGLLGIIGTDAGALAGRPLELALHQLRHRGPDGTATWSEPGVFFGHHRLAIIDRSDAGRQPMHSASGNSTIVFNGEIFNYLELRDDYVKRGVPIDGNSDTRVLLEGLERDGPSLFARLNGMWSFGAWDRTRRRLIFSRDRFGIKPLYYRHTARGFAFASEPKALLSLYPENRRINEPTLLNFLANNRLFSGNESFYDGIHVLPAAHYGVYDADTNSVTIARYWDYPKDVAEELAPDQAIAEFSSRFDDAVRLHLRSDVPVGVTLSGGLDSSAILASAGRRNHVKLSCFTSTYVDSTVGEQAWADRAAHAVGLGSTTRVPVRQTDWLSTLERIAWHMDSPGYSPAVFPFYGLMRHARATGVPVLLDGQGADEAFGGYVQYSVLEFLSYLRGPTRNLSMRGLSRRLAGMRSAFSGHLALAWLLRERFPVALRWHRRHSGFPSIMRDDLRLPEEGPRSECAPSALEGGGADEVRRRLLLDHAYGVLPALLHYSDAISMAHGVEVRVPYLDYRLVEWVFRLPTRYKIRDGSTKWVIREYLRRNGMEAIADRRDKKGYPTPAADWLGSDPGRRIEHALLGRPSPLHEWIDPLKIGKLFRGVRRGAMAADHHLYKLLSTQIWIDRCIEPTG